MQAARRDGTDDNGNGNESPNEMVLDSKLIHVGGKARLYISADDCVRVLQSMARTLQECAGDDPAALAQLEFVRELTAATTTAIEEAEANGYSE